MSVGVSCWDLDRKLVIAREWLGSFAVSLTTQRRISTAETAPSLQSSQRSTPGRDPEEANLLQSKI